MSEDNFASLEAIGLHSLATRLAAALPTTLIAPSEIAAAARVVEAVHRAHADALAQVWRDAPDALLGALGGLAAHAPFFLNVLERHPRWLIELAQDDLRVQRSAADYRRQLAPRIAATAPDEAGDELRRFKYFELARITLRELSIEIIPDEDEPRILAEISALADVLLDFALRAADARLQRKLGFDDSRDNVPGFVVLAMGKLGASELNYSSDVDLVYVFDTQTPPDNAAGSATGGLSPIEYYTRLAQDFGRLVAAQTAEGMLYRVDIELRPEGSRGALVVASTAFVNYYDTWAATWERAAAMKARPVAGDVDLGWRCVRALGPMLYRSSVDYESVAAISAMKERFDSGPTGDVHGFNIKHGPGGIRDVETVAQALQLLYGGRMPQIRQAGSEAAILALGEVNLLGEDDAVALLAAYRFLRRVEHRVQMIGERQTYTLPTQPDGILRIALSLGFSGNNPAEEFAAALERHCGFVRDLRHRLFPTDTTDRILGFFARRSPAFLANPLTRESGEVIAQQFAHAVEESANPQRALNNLEHFVDGVGGRRFYYELLLDRPELISRLCTLFAASEHLSAYLARYPRLIEPIFSDPSVLLLSQSQLEANFDQVQSEMLHEYGEDLPEARLDALRLFHHRELVNIGLLDLSDKITRAAAESALTDVAEVCVRRALDLAHRQLAHRAPPPGDLSFLVVGMGKLASRELTYGSDLDVIFLYDLPGATEYQLGEAQDFLVRLAQKLIWALCTRTATGVCYEIDARLRPSGNQGPLVTSLAAFRTYHAGSAQVWERQALLRARPVAGDDALAESFETVRRDILGAPLPAALEADIHRIRLRMEGEMARETTHRHDFKTGHGGLLDVESVVQMLQLRHGREHLELWRPMAIAEQIGALAAIGALPREQADALRHGWEFLQRLSSRLRIVENRSISDLDEERGDLESLARALGYTSPQRSGGARRALLDDYRKHTNVIRDVYESFFGTGASR